MFNANYKYSSKWFFFFNSVIIYRSTYLSCNRVFTDIDRLKERGDQEEGEVEKEKEEEEENEEEK